jgi:large subunit ribosomal protein L1
MNEETKFLEAIKTIRKTEKKVNFDQTVDLLLNLKNFDVRKEAFSLLVPLPHKFKEKKIAGFLEKDSKLIPTIKREDFPRYKEKKDIRKLAKSYDFFIANSKLMPLIATSFGRVLGPAGKMPMPQLGVLISEDDKSISALLEKISIMAKVKVKEPSIKLAIAKQSMKDEEIAENATAVFQKIFEALPKKNENLRSIMIKFTMGKPVKVQI